MNNEKAIELLLPAVSEAIWLPEPHRGRALKYLADAGVSVSSIQDEYTIEVDPALTENNARILAAEVMMMFR